MQEDLKDALRIPRGILLLVIVILSLCQLPILLSGPSQEMVFLVVLFILIPFVLPYYLSLRRPKMAGGILIYFGFTCILAYFGKVRFGFFSFLWGDILAFCFIVFFLGLGSWMIAIVRKYNKKSTESKSVGEVEGLE